MATSTMREQLYRQIEALPDDLVEQIAKFTQYIVEGRMASTQNYADWDDTLWQALSLGQLFREDEDGLCTLLDA
ncbi:MAG: hypothetical protein IAE81_24835 [Caldilineaceae bacterium]|nr:hypothetical protein [Caldilineaceae bacterium]